MSSQSHSTRRPRVRRIAILLLALLTVATVMTGCQRAKVGARCKTTDWGDDGGAWVLQCRNGRWVRALTKADAAKFLLAANTPKTTQPPATTAPPPPAITSFGAVRNTPVGHGSNQIVPGLYFTAPNGNGYCDILRTAPDGTELGERFAVDGPIFFSIPEGDARITTEGSCWWIFAPEGEQGRPPSGDGVHRVGVEIQPGRYFASNPGNTRCYYETSNSANGALSAITDASYSYGPQMVEIATTDVVFVSAGCGTWTPLPTLPNRFFELVASPIDPTFTGYARAFYTGSQLNTSLYTDGSGADHVVVSGQQWSLDFTSPMGGPLVNGQYTYEGPWSATQPNIRLIKSGGGGCFQTPGVVRIENVHHTGGTIDGVDITFGTYCSSSSPSFGRVHIAAP